MDNKVLKRLQQFQNAFDNSKMFMEYCFNEHKLSYYLASSADGLRRSAIEFETYVQTLEDFRIISKSEKEKAIKSENPTELIEILRKRGVK